MTDKTMEETIAETWNKIQSDDGGDFTDPVKDSVKDEVAEDEEVEDVAESAEVETEDAGSDSVESTDTEPVQEKKFVPKWKKAALAEWEKLPDLARAEIERRENDFHKGIEQYKTRAEQAAEWERVYSPYQATFNQLGMSPQKAAEYLFNIDHALRYGNIENKTRLVLQIAQGAGVDINTLANGIQQVAGEKVWEQQNPVDPRIQNLEARINQMQQQEYVRQQQIHQQEASLIDAEIAEFASNPDHEHFDTLRRDMGVLMSNGLAKSMEEAYEMALRANPQTLPVWQAQQQQKWAEARKAKIAKAKASGANVVKPNGRTSGNAQLEPKRTMEETIASLVRSQGFFN